VRCDVDNPDLCLLIGIEQDRIGAHYLNKVNGSCASVDSEGAVVDPKRAKLQRSERESRIPASSRLSRDMVVEMGRQFAI
jgi:hypothetical protein